MEWRNGDYYINDDKSKLSVDKIKELLSKSYWAAERSLEVIERSVRNSECLGVYYNDELVGFGRVVTDYATFYYICDIIIDDRHRGKGLGKELVRCITEKDELKGITGCLATKDAHGLYSQYGFETVDGRFMRRKV